MKIKNFLVVVGLCASTMSAAVLMPGDINIPVGSTTVAALSLAGGPLATDSATYSVVGGSGNTQHLSGTLISAVYRTSGGTLDFFYQVSQNPKTPANPSNNAATQDLFAPISTGFTTDAYYVGRGTLTGSPFLTPSTAGGFQAGTQSLTGSRNDFAVDFHLKSLALTNNPSTTTSAVFVIVTSATQYTTDIAQTAGGTVSANAGTFSPSPEPGFYGALAIGLGGLVMAINRRTKKAEAKAPTA